MTDSTNPAEDFRSQVQRLVAEGKLTAEEAQGLLENTGDQNTGVQYREVDVQYDTSGEGNVSQNLVLEVSGYTLQVVQDEQVSHPTLHANQDGMLLLEATPQGWRVSRRPAHQVIGVSNLRAILAVPFMPAHVQAKVSGGNLSLPDIAGEMSARVNGGNINMGQAASLQADVNGGNLNATEMHGPTHLSVNGGNLTLTGAHSLNASVNGGNLKWAGVLNSGDHRVEVNAGNVTLNLQPGSSVRVDAHVTVGGFKADFPTEKHGSFVTTRHTGQYGGGDALLSCKVAAGQLKVITQ